MNFKSQRIVFCCRLAIVFGLLFGFEGCYKAGNLKILAYPIDTKLRTSIIRRYIDSLALEKKYSVPEKWNGLNKFYDLDKKTYRIIYFESDPEEMFLLSFPGMLQLSDVYNPKIFKNDWVSQRNRITPHEELRIKQRFDGFLKEIEFRAHNDSLPDSLIYNP